MVSTGRRTNLIKHLVPSPSLGIVLLAALAPLFWIKSGHVAKAEDFILPMNLDQWVEFFSTWQTRVGFGSSPDDRLLASPLPCPRSVDRTGPKATVCILVPCCRTVHVHAYEIPHKVPNSMVCCQPHLYV